MKRFIKKCMGLLILSVSLSFVLPVFAPSIHAASKPKIKVKVLNKSEGKLQLKITNKSKKTIEIPDSLWLYEVEVNGSTRSILLESKKETKIKKNKSKTITFRDEPGIEYGIYFKVNEDTYFDLKRIEYDDDTYTYRYYMDDKSGAFITKNWKDYDD